MEVAEAVAILEALLFTADEPLAPDPIAAIFEDRTPEEVQALAEALNERYRAEGAGLQVQEVAGGLRLTTRPDLAGWVQRLNRVRPARLSRAALETLAVIAYRQPITKAEIEDVRGVSADGVLRTLLERDLTRVVGRKPDVGRPILYGTTRAFLGHFGFKDLTDLPTLREIEEILVEGEARRAGEDTGGEGMGAPGEAGGAAEGEPAPGEARVMGRLAPEPLAPGEDEGPAAMEALPGGGAKRPGDA